MVRTGETARVGVLGSHGEVGRQVAALLRASGHVVNCGNRSHHTSDERTAIVDAHDEESVNKFSRDLDVVVNCAGPSCLLKTSVASALPDSVGYIDPFGANSFDNYPTNRPCVVNAGATPGLSGLLLRHLAGLIDDCQSVTLCTGGRDRGGLSGLVDVVLSTHNSYGHPGKMIVDGDLVAYQPGSIHAEDLEPFPSDDGLIASPFVTNELRKVAQDFSIPRLIGVTTIPDRDTQQLLLRALSQTDISDPTTLMNLCADIAAAKTKLDAGKNHWFAIQATVHGTLRGRPVRVSGSVHAPDSTFITALFVAEATKSVIRDELLTGPKWGYELPAPQTVLSSLASYNVDIKIVGPTATTDAPQWSDDDDAGFI